MQVVSVELNTDITRFKRGSMSVTVEARSLGAALAPFTDATLKFTDENLWSVGDRIEVSVRGIA